MIWCWGLCRWYFTALHRKETRSPNGWLSRKIRALRFVREPILRSAFASWWQTPCCTRTFACGANTLAGAACAAVDRAVVSRPCADWEIESEGSMASKICSANLQLCRVRFDRDSEP